MAGAEYPWERTLGAVPGGDGTVEFRVGAPHPGGVDGRVRGADHELRPEGFGVRSARVEAAAGDDYVFSHDGRALPDPARPHQPAGLPPPPGLRGERAVTPVWSRGLRVDRRREAGRRGARGRRPPHAPERDLVRGLD